MINPTVLPHQPVLPPKDGGTGVDVLESLLEFFQLILELLLLFLG